MWLFAFLIGIGVGYWLKTMEAGAKVAEWMRRK